MAIFPILKMTQTICIFLLLLLLATTGQSQTINNVGGSVQSVAVERQQILILDTYQSGLPIPDSINRGIFAALREGGFSVGNVFMEHLDFARAPSSEHRTDMVNLLRHKLANKRIGVVISIGAPATNFMVLEGKELFPDATVLALISPNFQSLSNAYGKVINFPWVVDVAGTLRVALDLFPKTRRVFVVSGAHDNLLPFLDQARKAFAPWKGKLEFEYSNEMTYEEMLQRITTLPPDALVIYSPYFSDSTGRAFVPAEVVAKVCQATTAPVFATLEQFLGSGIVGGSLLRTEDFGKQAGKVALDYLNGRLKLVEPVTTFGSAPLFEFDWRELKRWNADISRLPKESIFINRDLTLWSQYKVAVITTVVVILVMAFLVAALAVLNRRLRRMSVAASDSEARFRIMIERAPEAIIVYNYDFKRIVDANAKAEQLFGCDKDKLLQGGPERFYSSRQPDGMSITKSMNDYKRRIMAGEEVIFERAVHSDDGRDLSCEVRLVPLPYLDQQLVRASFIDITERKRTEASLLKSEAHYRSLFDSSLIGITVTNREFIITDANDAFCKMLKYSKDELIGKLSFAEISHPEDVDKSIEMVRKLMTHEIDHFTLEKQYITKTGETIDGLIYVKGQYDLNGEFEGTTASILDISEFKRADKSLRESEGKYRNLFNNSEAAMFRSNLDGSDLMDVNQKFLEMLGRTREETIGKPSAILWADPKEREEMVRRLLTDGRVSGYEYKMLDQHGGIKNCITSLVLYREQNILEGSILDITNLKRAEEERHQLEMQLIHAQKMESLGVLSGGIAHDFNNIMAIIMGYCALTRMDYDTAENNITEIEKAAERAAGLCRQMLAYAGKAQLNKTQVNMWTLVDEMVTMLKSTLPQNAVIKPDLSARIPTISGDASQLRQIVMNLIINASEAVGKEQGEIRVSLARKTVIAGQSDKDYHGKAIPSGEYVCLEVTDNGCGMDEETKWRIFEPFYTTKFTGRGLGMSAVLGIINSHDGALQLFSQLGQGTTFKVSLPVQISDTTGDENLRPADTSAPWQGSGTILLVEDEEQVRLIAKTLLQMFGYTVLEAVNGKEALELYSKNAADINLVVTDMGMPVMDGYELFIQLKKLNPQLPIIISSGFGDAEVSSRIAIDDVAGLISKPYNPDQLREVLKSVLEGLAPTQS
ncbi:MAG: PAS domain S-box protein [Oryzomonas sp.]|jgi:PAS domain S-box-containing protein